MKFCEFLCTMSILCNRTRKPMKTMSWAYRSSLAGTRPGRLLLITMLLLMLLSPMEGEAVENRVYERDTALFSGRSYIAYTPRSFSVVNGVVTPAHASGVESDLRMLRRYFDGLVTYSAVNGLEKIPEIAKKTGFRALVLGLWDPLSPGELENLIKAIKAYPDLIAAVIVGNEGLYSKRYGPDAVAQAMKKIKAVFPKTPVATSEPFFFYMDPSYVRFFSGFDFLAPNVHPVFEPWFKPENAEQAVSMVIQVVGKMKEFYGKPVLVKETGMPSGPETRGFTRERQALFWNNLKKMWPSSPDHAYVCFEAFDASWKPSVMAETFPGDHTAEGFWGFFSSDGTPKPVLKFMPVIP